MALNITAVGGEGSHTLQKVNVNLDEDFIYFPGRDGATSIPSSITNNLAQVYRETTGAITGVDGGEVYFIKNDGFSLSFATEADGASLDLESYQTGSVTFNFPFVFNNSFNISSVKYKDQQAVRYLTSDTPIAGLTSGQVYYVKNLLDGFGGSSLYNFADHTFTTGGSTGRTGPTITTLKNQYADVGATWAVNYLSQGAFQGYQDWIVPTDGIYEFTVKGAPGRQGSALPGGGAVVRGRVRLTQGETVTISVGQRGELPPNNLSWPASSGGTFVVRKSGNVPLFIAGGGSSSGSTTAARNAVLTNTGGTSSRGYVGGLNGAGGIGRSAGGAGGGFFSRGGNSEIGGGGGGFNDGLLGGFAGGGSSGWGGFGGGAGSDGEAWGGSGGAGGYGGGGTNDRAAGVGGGGGSFILQTATNVATSDGTYNNSTTLLGQNIENLGQFNTGGVEGSVDVVLVEASVFGFALHESADKAQADIDPIAVEPGGSSYHALVPLTIDTVDDIINLTEPHGLFEGQAVGYFFDGTPVADLSSTDVYYVDVVDDYSFRLSLTPDPNFTVVNLRAPSNATSEGLKNIIVNTATNTITITNHGFLLNQPVRYQNGGGSNIVPLQNNATYYIKEVIDANRFKLSQSLNGPEINFTSPGSGSAHSFIFTVVNILEDSIYLPSHGYVSGQTVKYAKSRDLKITQISASGTSRFVTTTEAHGYQVNQRVRIDALDRPSISTPDLAVTNFSSTGQTRRLTTGVTHNLQVGSWVEVSGFVGSNDSRFNGTFIVGGVPTTNEFTYTAEESFTVSTTSIVGPIAKRNALYDYVQEERKIKIRSVSSSGTTRTIITDKPHFIPNSYWISVEGISGDLGNYFNGDYFVTSIPGTNILTYTGAYEGTENKEESITISTTNVIEDDATINQVLVIDSISSATQFRYPLANNSYTQSSESDVDGFSSIIGMYITNRNLTRRTRGQITTQANHNLQTGDRVVVSNMTGRVRDIFNGTQVVTGINSATVFTFQSPGNSKNVENVRVFSNTNMYINTQEPHNMESNNYIALRDFSGNDDKYFAGDVTITNRQSTATTRTVNTDNPHFLLTGNRFQILSMSGENSGDFIGDWIVTGVPNATTITFTGDTSVTVSQAGIGEISGVLRRNYLLTTVPSFSVSARSRSGNVADLTLNTTHLFEVGDKIRIANITGVNPEVFDGTHTITGVPATNRIQFQTATSGTITNASVTGSALGSHQMRLTIPTYTRTVARRELISNQVALYETQFEHNFDVGSTVTISGMTGNNTAVFNGTFDVQSVVNSKRFTVTRTPQANVTTFTITARSRSVNVADVTLNTTHNFQIGNSVTITSISGAEPEVFLGTHVITATPTASRIQFFTSSSGTIANASVSGAIRLEIVGDAASGGTITLNTIPKSNKQGVVQLIEATPEGFVGSLNTDTSITGLNNRQTYYILKLDDNIVRLADDPSLSEIPNISNVGIGNQQIITTSVDYINNTLTIPNHGFSLAELVEYDTAGGTAIGGLTSASPYYIIPLDGNTIQLAETANNATSGVAINLTTATTPTGRHTLKSLIRTPDGTYVISDVTSPTSFEVIANGTVPVIEKTFSPRFTVDLARNQIKVPSHGFLTGTKVVYGNGGGTDLGGLVDDDEYFVIGINKDYLRLAETAEDAASGVPLSIESYGAGTEHTFTSAQINGQITGTGTVSTEVDSILVNGSGTVFSKILKVGDNFRLFPPDIEIKAYFEDSDVNTSTDRIILDNHPFVTGNSGIFSPGSGGRRRFIARISSSSTTRTIVTGEAHGFTTGNSVTIQDLSSTVADQFEGTFTITVSNATTFTYVAGEALTLATENQSSGIAIQGGTGGVAPAPLVEGYYYYLRAFFDETGYNITARDRTSGVATVTLSTNHTFKIGNRVTIASISGVSPEVFNGEQTIIAIPAANQFQFNSAGANVTNASVTGTVTVQSSNEVSVHNLRSEALSGANPVDFSTQGSGFQLQFNQILPAPPIVRKISAIGSDEQITVDRAYTVAYTDVSYSYPTFLYVRPQGYSLHRPFDGGVEMSTGFGTWYGSIIRQTRKYFRYQSGKGIQTSAGINFKPSIDIETAFRVGQSNVIQVRTRRPHGLVNGLFVRVDDALDSFGVPSTVYNGTFQVTVIDSFNITMISNNQIVQPKAFGFPRLHVDAWENGALRSGMFDDQNGMFYEFDGQKLYCVRRSSTQQIAGTCAGLQGSQFVFGTNTAFTSQLIPGDYIVLRGQSYKVASVDSDTRITIKPEYKGSSGSEKEFDPQAIVTLADNSFTIISHGFTEDLPVVYNSIDGEPIGGLVNGRVYYVNVVNSNVFKLKPAPSSQVIVTLSSQGTTNVHSFVPAKTGIIATLTEDTRTPQEEWSIDPCDGTGPTGYDLDLSKIQMVYMDYSWYGAGKIRYGFKTTDGQVRYVHEFVHNNQKFESYFRSGNLPGRYEVVTYDNPTYIPTLFHWGTSVMMDGGFDDDKAYLFTKASQTLNIGGTTAKTFGSTAISPINDTINIPSHGFATGEAIQFIGLGTNSLPQPNTQNPATENADYHPFSNLQNEKTYFVRVVDTNNIAILNTEAAARATAATITTRAKSARTVTITTSAAHGYSPNQYVLVSLANDPFASSFNGVFRIITTTATQFTYQSFFGQFSVGSQNAPAGSFALRDVINFLNSGNSQATYRFSPAGTLNNSSGANYQPLISLRLSPSVSEGLTGALGDRDIINRMQLRLNEIGVQTNQLVDVKVLLNGRLNNLNFTGVDSPSLVQVVEHTSNDTVSGGIQVYNFKASGQAGQEETTSVNIGDLFELSNSILGGDSVFPDGPDIITIAVARLTGQETLTSANLSWAEAQA
jgi:hypothetical protein